MFNENTNINVDLNALKFPNDVYRVLKIDDKWDSTPGLLPDESFLSWFTRLAKENYSDVRILYKKYRRGNASINLIDKELECIQTIKKTRINLIKAIRPFIEIDEKSEKMIRDSPLIDIIHGDKWNVFLRPLINPNFCPSCLTDDSIPYFRFYWYLRFYVVCHVHNIILKGSCPHCYSPIEFWKTDWKDSLLQCIKCDKIINKGLKVVTKLSSEYDSKFQFYLLESYNKAKNKGYSSSSDLFISHFFRLMLIEVKDQEVNQLVDKDIKLSNERLLNSMLITYSTILEDRERLERPYICKIDKNKYINLEDLNTHIQMEHHYNPIPEIVDIVAKTKYKIIAPLLEMRKLTTFALEERANYFGMTTRTIRRYIKAFESYGIEGLGNKKRGLPDQVDEIIRKHVTHQCNCCIYTTSGVNKYRKIKEECNHRGLKYPTIRTIYRRKKEYRLFN